MRISCSLHHFANKAPHARFKRMHTSKRRLDGSAGTLPPASAEAAKGCCSCTHLTNASCSKSGMHLQVLVAPAERGVKLSIGNLQDACDTAAVEDEHIHA